MPNQFRFNTKSTTNSGGAFNPETGAWDFNFESTPIMPKTRGVDWAGSAYQIPESAGFGGAVLPSAPPKVDPPKPSAFSQERLFGDNGWAMPAIQGASALLGGIMSYQNLQLGKKSLAQSKDQFNRNFQQQRDIMAFNIQDRHRTLERRGTGSNWASESEALKAAGLR